MRVIDKRQYSLPFGKKVDSLQIPEDREHLEVLNSTKIDDLLIKFMNESINRVLLKVNTEMSEVVENPLENFLKSEPALLYEYLAKAMTNHSVPVLRGGMCGSIETSSQKHGVKCGLTNQLFETINCYRLLTEWRDVHVGDFFKQIDFIVEVPSCWDGAWGLCFDIKQCYTISHFFKMDKVAKRLEEEFSILLLSRMEYLEFECKKKVLIENLPKFYFEWIYRLKHNLFRTKNDYLRVLHKLLDLQPNWKNISIYSGQVNCREILYNRDVHVDEKYNRHLETSKLITIPINEAYWPDSSIETIDDTMQRYSQWFDARGVIKNFNLHNFDGEPLLNLGYVYNWWKVNTQTDVDIYNNFFTDISLTPEFDNLVSKYYRQILAIKVDGRIIGKNNRLVVIHTQMVPNEKKYDWMYAEKCMRLKDPDNYDWERLIVKELKIPKYSSVLIIGYGFQHKKKSDFPVKKLFEEHAISLYIQTDIMPIDLDTQFKNSIISFWLALRCDLFVETVCESQFASHVLYVRQSMGKLTCASNDIDLSHGTSAKRYMSFAHNQKSEIVFTYPHYFKGMLYKMPRCENLLNPAKESEE
ncbi:hypothetical protein ABK040_014103 [Willaertia magna]